MGITTNAAGTLVEISTGDGGALISRIENNALILNLFVKGVEIGGIRLPDREELVALYRLLGRHLIDRRT